MMAVRRSQGETDRGSEAERRTWVFADICQPFFSYFLREFVTLFATLTAHTHTLCETAITMSVTCGTLQGNKLLWPFLFEFSVLTLQAK